MARLFERDGRHEVIRYDKFIAGLSNPARKDAVNRCDLVFVSAPTPTASDGLSCDLSAVEECVRWIEAPVCIRSTIVPGTCDRLSSETGRPLSFSPEYIGESSFHPWREDGVCGFLIVGGPQLLTDLVLSAYQGCVAPGMQFHRTTALTAELCKYMENCFLATKVAFMNQFFDIASAFQVDFSELRRLWLADPRVGESHTIVTSERGFRGRCLPKDVAAIISAVRPLGGAPLLEAVLAYNAAVCEAADQRRGTVAASGLPSSE
jgi:UDPglucose 6-dehydrogenase